MLEFVIRSSFSDYFDLCFGLPQGSQRKILATPVVILVIRILLVILITLVVIRSSRSQMFFKIGLFKNYVC